MNSLGRILTTIKEKTRQILIPFSIQPSPTNISTDLVLIMRSIKGLNEAYLLGEKPTEDVNALAAKFVVR